jgi:hypothetical protein
MCDRNGSVKQRKCDRKKEESGHRGSGEESKKKCVYEYRKKK